MFWKALREIALLRALGASRVQVAQRQYVPLLSLGLLSGLLAALGASAAGWGLAHFVFDFSYTASAWIYFVGTFGGGLCAVAVGYLGLRPILNTPPLATLREA